VRCDGQRCSACVTWARRPFPLDNVFQGEHGKPVDLSLYSDRKVHYDIGISDQPHGANTTYARGNGAQPGGQKRQGQVISGQGSTKKMQR